MFDEEPRDLDLKSLDLEGRLQSSERGFNEIPILLPRSYGGFGDIMVTLKLAEGLKTEFPDQRVTVYFGREEDYQKVRRIYPNFDASKLEAALNGISVAQVSDAKMREIMSRSLVGIFSPIPADNRIPAESLFMDAEVNLYLEEYDASHLIGLPSGIKRNRVHQDPAGRKHLVLPTGFQEDAIGIHIDHTLVGLSTEATAETKQSILEKAGFQWVAEHIQNLLHFEWGMAYYAEASDSRKGHNSYLESLSRSLKETNNPERAVAIFDFSDCNVRDVEEDYPFRQFTELFLEEDGTVKTLKVRESNYYQPPPNVYIVHVGPQNHDTFIDFLRYSQLPALITGDCSLSEAISLDKIFIYGAPSWKGRVFPAMVDLAADYLEDWRDVDRIGALFGRDRVKEEDVHNYPEVEQFYLKYREAIHEAKRLENEHRDGRDYQTKAWQLFSGILKEQGNEQSEKLGRYFEQHWFAFSMAYYGREKSVAEELRILRKRHIFGFECGYVGQEETSKLFYDETYQAAFHRLNQALIGNVDICKNLAKLIREAVEKYRPAD